MAALPSGATEQAAAMHATWTVFLRIGIGVAVIVYGLIAWCLVRYRKRATDTQFPVQFRRNDRMEIVYTVIPILLVTGLFFISFAAERRVEAIPLRQDVVVDVTGFRWSWRFEYPELGGVDIIGTHDRPPELVLPVGSTTRLNVTSVDVDHSFWVPDFLFKRDAIPGLRNVFAWTPTTIGTFRGECGEFCGLDHARMAFSVRVVSREDFARWVSARRRVAPAHPLEAVR
jgi:cytochrome c oxidase subunit 2